MKKIVALLLAVACIFGVFALNSCKNKTDDLSKAYVNYLNGIKKNATTSNGTLTVATSPDFAPMEFYDAAKSGSDAIVGFDILLANYIAADLGMKLEIKPMSFDACQAAVQTGAVDLAISGFSYTEERAENYAISDWYEAGDNETEQVMIAATSSGITLTDVDSVLAYAASYKTSTGNDLKIGFQGASLQEILVKENFTDKANINIDNSYVDLGTAAEALKTNKIQLLAVAKGNGDSIIANSVDTIAFTGFEFYVKDLYKNNVILLNKSNTALLTKVNAALAKAKAANLYTGWYDACKVYAGISTLDELGFDENGNKITE